MRRALVILMVVTLAGCGNAKHDEKSKAGVSTSTSAIQTKAATTEHLTSLETSQPVVAEPVRATPGLYEFRSRKLHEKSTDKFDVVLTKEQWDPHKTAVVICDMWDHHWCKSATARVAEMAPRMNEVISALRSQGVLIIHCPGGTMPFYEGTPQRKLAQSAPAAPLRPRKQPFLPEGPFPIDASDGGCPDEPHCSMGSPWRREIATLEIKPGDGITDNGESYSLMRQKGVDNVIVMGVHTNMCVLNRPYAIKVFVNRGLNVALMRDLTDTMYNPKMPPMVNHFTGTDLVVEFIEKYWCPTITSDQVIGGKPFHFAADTRPAAVVSK